MTVRNTLLVASLILVNFAIADGKKNPGTVKQAESPKAAKTQEVIKKSTVPTTPQDLEPSATGRKLVAPTVGGGDEPVVKTGGPNVPRDTIHVVPGGATKFDIADPSNHRPATRPAAPEFKAEREIEEPGKLSAGATARNKVAIDEKLYEDAAFEGATGRLKELLAREKSKGLSAQEQLELTKLKVEIAEMLKVQAEIETRGKGSPTVELVKTISDINDVISNPKRMQEINQAVADARAQGKVVPQEAVDNLLRNVVDTYAALGLHNGAKKGTEKLGYDAALKNLTNLQGDQLVGFIKYMDSYGAAYRKYRAELQDDPNFRGVEKEIEAHRLATLVRRKFVDDRAATAKVETLRNRDALNKKLCECTGACLAA